MGNPAAVCLLAKSIPVSVLQSIAAEMNLSETAFVQATHAAVASHPDFRDGSTFNLRWFTPKAEVPLCGHATLAAAAVLMQGAVRWCCVAACCMQATKASDLTLQGKAISKNSFILRP